MSKYVFKADDIEINKPKIFDIPCGSKVTVNHFQFGENQVSKIEVERIKFIPDTIFINLYSGNIRIGNLVTKKTYAIGIIANIQDYYISPVNEYYEEIWYMDKQLNK